MLHLVVAFPMDAHTTPSVPFGTPLSDVTCAICANETVTLLRARQTLQTVVQRRQCDLRHVICTQALDNTSEEVMCAEPLSNVCVAAVELERIQQGKVDQVEENFFQYRFDGRSADTWYTLRSLMSTPPMYLL